MKMWLVFYLEIFYKAKSKKFKTACIKSQAPGGKQDRTLTGNHAHQF